MSRRSEQAPVIRRRADRPVTVRGHDLPGSRMSGRRPTWPPGCMRPIAAPTAADRSAMSDRARLCGTDTDPHPARRPSSRAAAPRRRPGSARSSPSGGDACDVACRPSDTPESPRWLTAVFCRSRPVERGLPGLARPAASTILRGVWLQAVLRPPSELLPNPRLEVWIANGDTAVSRSSNGGSLNRRGTPRSSSALAVGRG